MNGDLSSHNLNVASTQNQLQLSQTGVMIDFTGEMWRSMKFFTAFSLEMTFMLGTKSTVSRSVSPPVCVHVCLFVSARWPLGVTRDVHGPEKADIAGVCVQWVRFCACVKSETAASPVH